MSLFCSKRRFANNNSDRNGDGDVFGSGKMGTTQGTFFNVTLDMHTVTTAPKVNNSSFKGFETHWTLFHVAHIVFR